MIMATEYYVYLIISMGALLSSEGCLQVYPTEYSYNPRTISRPPGEMNCQSWITDDFSNYRTCSHPSLLTDSVNGSIYEWLNSEGQVLFTFPSHVILTHISLLYDDGGKFGLPNVVFLAVADDFEIWHETSGTIFANVRAIQPGGQHELRNKTVGLCTAVNVTTKKVLMYKFYATFHFSLNEVEFFRDCGNNISGNNQSCSVGNNTTSSGSTTTLSTTTATATFTSNPTTNISTTTSTATVTTASTKSDTASTDTTKDVTQSSGTTTLSSLATDTVGADSIGSPIVGASVGVAVFITLFCFIGLPLCIILVIIQVKKWRQKNNLSTESNKDNHNNVSPPHIAHTPNYELNGQDGNMGAPHGEDEIESSLLYTEVSNIHMHNPHFIYVPEYDKPHVQQSIQNATDCKVPGYDTHCLTSTYSVIGGDDCSRRKDEVHVVIAHQNQHVLSLNGAQEDDTDNTMATHAAQDATASVCYVNPHHSPTTQHTVDSLKMYAPSEKHQCKARDELPDIPPPAPLQMYSEEEDSVVETTKKETQKKITLTNRHNGEEVEIPEGQDNAPPVPPHTVECLYAAINKKPVTKTSQVMAWY